MGLSLEELESRWQKTAPSPREGAIQLIVARKGGGVHETPARVELTPEGGVHGDRWIDGKPDKPPNPDCQVTLMNVEVARLLVGDGPLHGPGDNFLVDVDLSEAALPVGTRLRIGSAVLEVAPAPHTGCKKFAERFGVDALKWVNAKTNRPQRLRGVNCRVVSAGSASVGDPVRVEPG